MRRVTDSVNSRTLKFPAAARVLGQAVDFAAVDGYSWGMSARRRPPAPSPREPDPLHSRAEQKQKTRQALLDAALGLLAEQSFDSLSLREIARTVGVVPTAFYRHFDSVEELGLVLVDDAFRTLRRMMRIAREAPLPHEELVHRSVLTFAQYVQAQRAYFRFVTRERFGGSSPVRAAIHAEVNAFVTELCSDLTRFPPLDRWAPGDLHMLASLLVSTMVAAVERTLEATDPSVDDATRNRMLAQVIDTTERQLQLILLGAAQWPLRSEAAAVRGD